VDPTSSSGGGIEKSLSLFRAVNVTITAFDQQPLFLGHFILSAATKLIFRLSGRRAQYVGWLLNLTAEQIAALGELGTGQCLTVFSDENSPGLFLQKFPKAPDMRHLSRAEIEELSLQSLQPWLEHVLAERVEPAKAPQAPKPPQLLDGLPLKVLQRIVGQPPETIEERCAALDIDRNQEYAARCELIKLGMLEDVETFGHHRQLSCLTEKGRTLAEQMGLRIHKCKSGPVHEWTLRTVERHLSRACPKARFLHKDSSLAGRQPDGFMMLPGPEGHRVAIQIVCSKNYEHECAALVDIASLNVVDLVLVFTAKAAYQKSLERALESTITDKTMMGKIRILPIEPCLKPDFDWGLFLEPLWPGGQKE